MKVKAQIQMKPLNFFSSMDHLSFVKLPSPSDDLLPRARARLCRPRPHAGRLLVGAVLVGPQLGQVGGRGVPVAVREGALVEVVAVLALPEM